MAKVQVKSGGVGFLGLLALLFIGLKLGGVIGWSWWWVLAPLWVPTVIVLAVGGVFCGFCLTMAVLAKFIK